MDRVWSLLSRGNRETKAPALGEAGGLAMGSAWGGEGQLSLSETQRFRLSVSSWTVGVRSGGDGKEMCWRFGVEETPLSHLLGTKCQPLTPAPPRQKQVDVLRKIKKTFKWTKAASVGRSFFQQNSPLSGIWGHRACQKIPLPHTLKQRWCNSETWIFQSDFSSQRKAD